MNRLLPHVTSEALCHSDSFIYWFIYLFIHMHLYIVRLLWFLSRCSV